MFTLLYVTCDSTNQAHDIAEALMQEKLAACVNILPPCQAIYASSGVMKSHPEVSFFVKTSEAKKEAVVQRIQELQDHECFCILTLPVSGGSEQFLTWMEAQLSFEGALEVAKG